MNVFPRQCEEKKNDDVSHFLIIPSTLSRKKCNTKECGKKGKKKKNKQNFYYRASLFFSEKEEQPILTETCLIKKFCGKICQCSRSPDSVGDLS